MKIAAGLAGLAAYYYTVPAHLSALFAAATGLPPSRVVGIQAASFPLVYLALHLGDEALVRKTGVECIDANQKQRHTNYRARWRFWDERKRPDQLTGAWDHCRHAVCFRTKLFARQHCRD